MKMLPFFSQETNFREAIMEMQGLMEGENLEETCPLNHCFAPGVYARTILLPAGGVILGKIHKHAHLNIISEGRVEVATQDGHIEYTATAIFTSTPGTKRAVYAFEDTLWTTIHLTDETDLEKIEDEIIAKSFEEYDAFKLMLESDYNQVLMETGKTEAQIKAISNNPLDQIEVLELYNALYISTSSIEGVGVFSHREINKGEKIGPARISGKRTMLGRYVNHSGEPNAEYIVLNNGDLDTVAIKTIPARTEILNNYRQGAQISNER